MAARVWAIPSVCVPSRCAPDQQCEHGEHTPMLQEPRLECRNRHDDGGGLGEQIPASYLRTVIRLKRSTVTLPV